MSACAPAGQLFERLHFDIHVLVCRSTSTLSVVFFAIVLNASGYFLWPSHHSLQAVVNESEQAIRAYIDLANKTGAFLRIGDKLQWRAGYWPGFGVVHATVSLTLTFLSCSYKRNRTPYEMVQLEFCF